MLERGFTTVRDVAGGEYGLAQAVEEGYLHSPCIIFGGEALSHSPCIIFGGEALSHSPRIIFGGEALSQTGGHADMRNRGQMTLENCPC